MAMATTTTLNLCSGDGTSSNTEETLSSDESQHTITPTNGGTGTSTSGVRRSNRLRGSLGSTGKTESKRKFHLREESVRSEMKVLANSLERKISNNSVLQELSVNKLQFCRLGLVGREKEVAILEDRLNSLKTSPQTKQFVLISGVSGAGKSALAQTLHDRLTTRKEGVFIRGKFDQKAGDEPYSIITMACHDLVIKIKELADHSVCQIRDQLHQQLVGIEMKLLAQAVPALQDILADHHDDAPNSEDLSGNPLAEEEDSEQDTTTTSGGTVADLPNTKELLESSFRKFFRILSSYFPPLILCLDDLQWSDVGTLELLKGIVSDTSNDHGLMVVGCYRSNEVDETHILSQMVRDLRQSPGDHYPQISEIHVGNLDVDQSNQLVMKLLDEEDPSKTKDLTEICYSRTMGNPFFLLVYMEMLNRDEFITFHLGTFSWNWNIARIKAKTGATANVVDLMTQKINQSSEELVHLLKLAACLGNTFSAGVLFMVWALSKEVIMKFQPGTSKGDYFKVLLDQAMGENFLERSEDSLRWVHDKVQEAASLLEPEEEYSLKQYEVGKTLQACLDEHELEESLFCVVNLLNHGSPQSRSDGIKLAQLNLRAAKKAKGFTAFGVQAAFAERGIKNLPPDCWDEEKDLATELYFIRAAAASCVGDFETMTHFCNVVLEQPECTMLDKIPCYNVMIDSLSRTGRMKEAMNLGLDVLGKLGCKMPRSTAAQALGAVTALLRFKGNLKKITPTVEELSQMPQMVDPVQKEVVRLMSETVIHAYHCKCPLVWLLGNIKMVYITLEYGLVGQAQTAFASCAVMIMHILGDWKHGYHYAQLSLQMHERLEEYSCQVNAIAISRPMVVAWMQPLQSQLRYTMEGYKIGMEIGDTAMSFGNIVFNLEIAMVCGRQLPALLEDIQIYLPQFEEMNASQDYSCMIRLFWQTALNLMGSENTTVLSGAAMTEEGTMSNAGSTTLDKFAVMKSFLCVYFGEHELGAKLALQRGNRCIQDSPGHPCVMVEPFLRSMSLYAMARETGGWNYKRQAAAARSIVKKYVKNGNPNVYHHLELLNAERAALKKRDDKEVSEHYKNAARAALRSGCTHDAALSNERFACYLMEQKNDMDAACRRMRQAVECYRDWGATQKVKMLQEKYGDLLKMAPQLLDSSVSSLSR